LKTPHGLTFRNGLLYVADTNNDRLLKFLSDGTYVSQYGEFGTAPGQLNTPYDLDVNASGTIYVADTDNNRVQKLAPVPLGAPVNKAIIVAGGGPFKGNYR